MPLRVVIFQRLAKKPSTASELAQELPITRPAVVQHLTVLRRHGLVDAAVDGKRRIYRTTPSGLSPLRDWLARHERPSIQI